MKTFKRTKDYFGNVNSYICNENPAIVIIVERGALSHNEPTGYTLTFNGSTSFAGNNIVSYMTLKEAKDWADYYFKD